MRSTEFDFDRYDLLEETDDEGKRFSYEDRVLWIYILALQALVDDADDGALNLTMPDLVRRTRALCDDIARRLPDQFPRPAPVSPLR